MTLSVKNDTCVQVKCMYINCSYMAHVQGTQVPLVHAVFSAPLSPPHPPNTYPFLKVLLLLFCHFLPQHLELLKVKKGVIGRIGGSQLKVECHPCKVQVHLMRDSPPATTSNCTSATWQSGRPMSLQHRITALLQEYALLASNQAARLPN